MICDSFVVDGSIMVDICWCDVRRVCVFRIMRLRVYFYFCGLCDVEKDYFSFLGYSLYF